MTRLSPWSIVALVLCGFFVSSQAQEFNELKKNTVFLGVSLFHYEEAGKFQASDTWWAIPNITYQRLINSKSKLSIAYTDFTKQYLVSELYQVELRGTTTFSLQYGRQIFKNNNFTMFINGGVAVRHLSETWIVAIIGRPGWTEIRTDSYYDWGVGAAFRLDAHYTINDRININPHIDYQYYFDGRARQFFAGLLVGYNFGN